jgi:hypothetical protein
MESVDLNHEPPNGALTSALIRTILESRRALRMAIALTEDLMREGASLQWETYEDELETIPKVVDGVHVWDRADHSRAQAARVAPVAQFSKRSTPRHGLRLVLPDRHESPLVMPADSPFTSAEPKRNELRHDRRKLDPTEGEGAGDVGQADG